MLNILSLPTPSHVAPTNFQSPLHSSSSSLSSSSSSSATTCAATSTTTTITNAYKYHTISHASSPHHLSLSPPSPTTRTNSTNPSPILSNSSSSPFPFSRLSFNMPLVSQKSGLISNRNSSWLQHNSTQVVTNNGCKPLHSVFPTAPAVVSAVEDLYDFICSGPLIDKLGVTPETVAAKIDKWLEYGLYVCRLFQLNELSLTFPQKSRVFHYYIPVFIWCQDQISQHRSKFKDDDDIPPLVIGFSAPQGCGKTTLVFALDYLFRVTGRQVAYGNYNKSATISIDDFYLTYEDQAKLREENPENALLEYRGNAGSHDLPLSVETLAALTKLTKEGMKMKLPRYDKSAYGGRGDRADPSTWPEIEGPLTVVLFEGWMLGFKPVPMEVVEAIDPQLEIVNKNLEAYYDAWDKFINSWIVIKIKEPKCVYQWRLQAEIAMREEGKPGMSDEEVMDFVSRYLPAYKAYLPTLYSEGPNGSDPEHLLVIDIDEGRNAILGN
ncbi:hypothetical protein Sjap_011349 [Stephania japonica]|uniref:Uncharacterized protein n=1 Tax=Stephania japonica TaxID=461633 RepID=A0AAP0JDC3_9MAGN